MSTFLKPNTVNEVKKGTVLFTQEEKTSYICLVAKGKILAEAKGIRAEIPAGQMICVFDAYFSQSNLCKYTVLEDSVLYAVPSSSEEGVLRFLAANPEYRGVVYGSLCRQLAIFSEAYRELAQFSKNQYEYAVQHFEQLERNGKKDHLPTDFLERSAEDEIGIDAEDAEIDFYVESGKIPFDIQGKYYNQSEAMTDYQVDQVSGLIRTMIYGCESACDYIRQLTEIFINPDETGLYNQEVQFAVEMKQTGQFNSQDLKAVNETKDRLSLNFVKMEQKYGLGIKVDTKKITDIFTEVLKVPTVAEEKSAEEEVDISVLDYSLKQILEYADVSPETKDQFKKSVDAFVDLHDRLDTADDIRKLRKSLTNEFYPIYQSCAVQALLDPKAPKIVKLFVNYGYVDERLLNRDQLSFLLKINQKAESSRVHVYTVLEWLAAIYEGTKQPSRNEFEQGYPEYLREQKKNGYITAEEETKLLDDKMRKLEFEIQNMIRYNTKVVNGKISTYVPILYQDQFLGDLDKCYVSKEMVIDSLLNLEDKDFSIFMRHTLYSEPKARIEKEYIEKKVYPDIVLLPVYGSSASMWQEIETRKRDTPGRFLFPIFCEEKVDDLMIKMFGRFQWEYCRCEMGASWNDIQNPCLTSEYSDYIQYYRKNHALTEEKREKIKTQITRAKNNLREIFVQDYTEWIKNESKGSIKLNKVARAILATYCPMNKEYRQVMDKNAAMTEAMAKYRRELGKTIKEYELHMRALQKKNVDIPKVMEDTYQYYLDQQEQNV